MMVSRVPTLNNAGVTAQQNQLIDPNIVDLFSTEYTYGRVDWGRGPSRKLLMSLKRSGVRELLCMLSLY